MGKESGKKCSHCGQNGHNSRTCNGRVSFKLFGVTIETENEDLYIRKNKSTGDLLTYNVDQSVVNDGYLSDGPIHSKKIKIAHERKKGAQWNEEEHQSFLLGLEMLGKGDWKGISKDYVPTRTPTQVASHAQKYFIRLEPTEKKRRSSLFDMPLKESATPPPASLVSPSKTPAETSEQASTSLVSFLKKTNETRAQASTSAQVAKSQDVPRVLPMAATYGVPEVHCMPYMVGVPSSWQSYPHANVMPTLPFVAVMNYNPNPNSAPFMTQFSTQMFPQLIPRGSTQAGSLSLSD